MPRFLIGLIAGCTCAAAMTGRAAGASGPADALPPAIYTDAARDPVHPARSQAFRFPSHGAMLNGLVYLPPGGGPHPTALLFHGLPGNEQNLDLAQALRRAGWAVVTFHYTGAWGSGGRFTLHAGIEDADELIRFLRHPGNATPLALDPDRLLIVGHSYGGYVAAAAAGHAAGVNGVILIAPWDLSHDQRRWSPLPRAARDAAIASGFDDVEGRLTGADAAALGREVLASGAALDLAQLAPRLLDKPLLLITATRDDDDDQAVELSDALRRLGAQRLTREQMDTDHSFNDQRIALQASILRWLAENLRPSATAAARPSAPARPNQRTPGY
jgi:pimeloyl-ACP methyl ester carboxylesterase